MTKGRNTTVIALRVTDDERDIIKKRADRKGWNISDYMKWLALRPHKGNASLLGITTTSKG